MLVAGEDTLGVIVKKTLARVILLLSHLELGLLPLVSAAFDQSSAQKVLYLQQGNSRKVSRAAQRLTNNFCQDDQSLSHYLS